MALPPGAIKARSETGLLVPHAAILGARSVQVAHWIHSAGIDRCRLSARTSGDRPYLLWTRWVDGVRGRLRAFAMMPTFRSAAESRLGTRLATSRRP